MCLILLAIKAHPRYRLIIAGNRDEYYDRPAAPAGFWKEAPELLAGMDLRAGGTWFGITRTGRIAAITNYRDPASLKKNAPSRGNLVSQFLLGKKTPRDYLKRLDLESGQYNGFNLIVGKKEDLYWYSNRDSGIKKLKPGLHGLSNHLINIPWPKVLKSKEAFSRLISENMNLSADDLFQILSDKTKAEDKNLPDTGVGPDWERTLSPVFITSPSYGTRASSVLFIDSNDHVTFIEKTFDAGSDRAETVQFEFQIHS